jgi:hypothetical protein
MAFTFTDGDGVVLANHPALALPDSNWAFGGLIRFASRAGSIVRSIISYGEGTSIWYRVVVGDASAGSNPDDIQSILVDDDGTTVGMNSTSNPFASNTSWTHVLVFREGSTCFVYIDGVQVAFSTNASFDAVTPTTDFIFGNNHYFSASFLGDMAEWAKWDRKPSDEEIAALVARYAPSCFPNELKWYVPMIGDAVESVSGIEVSNEGATISEHPRMIYCS